MTERQELYCHHCNRYVQFDIDVSLNGDHVIICPNCEHEHCRVVKDGKVTDVRWDSRNTDDLTTTYYTSNTTTDAISTFDTYSDNSTATGGTSTSFYYGAWMNRVNGC